jgi:EAL domain-containing protein (putative c-di-GMP-specific phosphodiesterase class I)
MLCIASALNWAQDLPSGSCLFVNIDPGTLFNKDFSAGDVLDLVRSKSIDPAKVVFEITEVTALPIARLVGSVESLRSCGFGIALDGLGSGNLGLEMMRLLKFEYVKIDRSVVQDAVSGGPGRAIILAIAAFARESNTFMIVEGVESREMLNSLSCDEGEFGEFGAQGFYFGEPSESLARVTKKWPGSVEGLVA